MNVIISSVCGSSHLPWLCIRPSERVVHRWCHLKSVLIKNISIMIENDQYWILISIDQNFLIMIKNEGKLTVWPCRAQPDDPRTMPLPVPADHQQDHGEILLQAAWDLCLLSTINQNFCQSLTNRFVVIRFSLPTLGHHAAKMHHLLFF